MQDKRRVAVIRESARAKIEQLLVLIFSLYGETCKTKCKRGDTLYIESECLDHIHTLELAFPNKDIELPKEFFYHSDDGEVIRKETPNSLANGIEEEENIKLNPKLFKQIIAWGEKALPGDTFNLGFGIAFCCNPHRQSHPH